MKAYILARLGELSTWRALVAVVTAFGIHLDPAQQEAIITAGVTIYGLLGAFFPDKLGKAKTADGTPVDLTPGQDPFGYPELPREKREGLF